VNLRKDTLKFIEPNKTKNMNNKLKILKIKFEIFLNNIKIIILHILIILSSIIRFIIQLPFIIYLGFIMFKMIKQSKNMGNMSDSNGKWVFSQEWMQKVCFPVLDTKIYLKKHICWIFWIVISILITLYKI
jgi:hypothetical protein